jgi:hypothetical protein
MCRRTGEAEAPSTARGSGTVEGFINMRRYVRFSPAVLWQTTHQCNELFGGGSRLGLGQRGAQLGYDLVAHRDLDLRAGTDGDSCRSFRRFENSRIVEVPTPDF